MRQALSKETLLRVYDGAAARYDSLHGFLTAGSDQRGRALLVEHAVRSGDHILDSGAGTGRTGVMAVQKAGPGGRAVLFDMSDGMLEQARRRAAAAQVEDRVAFLNGDILHLPFEDGMFDTTLSTYSLCPVYSPAEGARELYRVTRPGGRIGVAHSTDPANPVVRKLAEAVEAVVWRIPAVSLGCRSVSVLPELQALGCKLVFSKAIGVPLWPFFVFVVEKPKE